MHIHHVENNNKFIFIKNKKVRKNKIKPNDNSLLSDCNADSLLISDEAKLLFEQNDIPNKSEDFLLNQNFNLQQRMIHNYEKSFYSMQ